MPTTDERLISSLLGVMRTLERPLIKHVSDEKLTGTQFAVMEMLLHKGERTINDIIAGVFSTSGNISVVINNLISAGLLEKKVNPNDGRSRLIGLTAAGEAKIKAYYPKHIDELHRLLAGFDSAQKEELIKQLVSLRTSIEMNNQA